MWLRTLSKKCGSNVKKEDLQDTCCAFKEPFPEVALLTGARKKNLMVPNEEKRKNVAAKPLWGFRHDPGADAVMGLGFYPSVAQFQYFVGSLRKTGFRGDIVMAVGPKKKLKRKVEEYLRNQRVLSYPFEYSCSQKGMSRRRLLATPGGCVLDDWYVDGDSRGPRPLALARYEMYETWLRQYSSTSYALVLDTRDTFFQRDPSLLQRPYCLHVRRRRGPARPRRAAASVDGVRGCRVASRRWRLAPPVRHRRDSQHKSTESKPHDAQNDTVNTQVRLARPEEEEKGPGPRQGLVCVRGERPQDGGVLSVEPGLAERVLPEHAERPVGARAVLREHAGF